jgi:hypothetical protein
MSKPIDLYLCLGLAIWGIIMYLIPSKRPTMIVVALTVAFVLIVYPVWTFWWIEKSMLRRCAALLIAAICLGALGYYNWPRQTTSFVQNFPGISFQTLISLHSETPTP